MAGWRTGLRAFIDPSTATSNALPEGMILDETTS
jgi:hypothetical protein